MKIDVEEVIPPRTCPDDMIGNVYTVRGGFGSRNGHMHVIIAATDKVLGNCRYNGYTTITVDREGDIVGANHYAYHYFDEKTPIARVEGLDEIHLILRRL